MSFDYESALSPPASGGIDKELQTFVQTIQQRAEFQNHVNHLASVCWDKCATGYPSSKLDAKKANCIENCTERYLDVSMLLRSRFQSMLSNLQH
ncbi:Mitochondrial import inner membrane translocase subunit Tim8 isoform 1 [Schistosoma japonicum]